MYISFGGGGREINPYVSDCPDSPPCSTTLRLQESVLQSRRLVHRVNDDTEPAGFDRSLADVVPIQVNFFIHCVV